MFPPSFGNLETVKKNSNQMYGPSQGAKVQLKKGKKESRALGSFAVLRTTTRNQQRELEQRYCHRSPQYVVLSAHCK